MSFNFPGTLCMIFFFLSVNSLELLLSYIGRRLSVSQHYSGILVWPNEGNTAFQLGTLGGWCPILSQLGKWVMWWPQWHMVALRILARADLSFLSAVMTSLGIRTLALGNLKVTSARVPRALVMYVHSIEDHIEGRWGEETEERKRHKGLVWAQGRHGTVILRRSREHSKFQERPFRLGRGK